MFAHFWLCQCLMVLRPHLYCLTSRFTIVRSLGFLGLGGIWSGVLWRLRCFFAVDSIAGSCDCLAQGCRCADFFPYSAVFTLVLGISVLAYGILALPLLFLGHAFGVAFFGSVCLSSACLSCGSWPCGPCVWVGLF